MRYVFIVNPCAGSRDSSKELTDKITDAFAGKNLEHKIIYTEYAKHATEIAEAEAAVGDEVTIFACGGDGTNAEVLKGVYGCPNVTLGLIPIGTANDYIKYYGEASEFTDIVNQIDGGAKSVDLIAMNNKIYSLNVCSAGMDAIVADNMHKYKKLPISAKMSYNLAIVDAFFSKIGSNFDISIDDEEPRNKDCLFAVCANARIYGGGYKCAPTAIPYDGSLEYCIIKTRSRLKVLSILGKYSSGEHIHLKECEYGSCRKMKIVAKELTPINVDGEIYHEKEISFEILKKAIKLHLPKSVMDKFEFVNENVELTTSV